MVGISPPRAAERAPGSAAADGGVARARRLSRASLAPGRPLPVGGPRGWLRRRGLVQRGRRAPDRTAAGPSPTARCSSRRRSGAATAARPVGLLVMEKRAESWRFVAVGPDGEVVSDARVAPCAECHRDAPRDFVFRRPSEAPAGQSSSAAANAATTATAPTTVATAAATYDARSAGSAPAPSSR